MRIIELQCFCFTDVSHFQKLKEETSFDFDIHWNSEPRAIGKQTLYDHVQIFGNRIMLILLYVYMIFATHHFSMYASLPPCSCKNIFLQIETNIQLSSQYYLESKFKSNRKAMNRNWSNQKANPALKTKTGNK